MSSIGWIDFSSEHRDKVRTVIDLLSAPGVVDELGIGIIRDSFADRMFPGISTIQTRPKYYTLTALLLRDYVEVEKQKRRPRPFERYLEDEEKACRIQLVETHGEDRQNIGIIGGTFGLRRDRDVVRRASSVYWNGLRQFGFVSPRNLSLPEFGRRLADERHEFHALLQDSGGQSSDDPDAADHSNRVRIVAPVVSDDYREKLSIELLPEEAVFLRQQITACQPDSLIGQILMSDENIEEVLKLKDRAGFAEFSELPFIGKLKSEELRQAVHHARSFWDLLKGAHIRYNCLLQARFGTEELLADFESQWEEWQDRLPNYLVQWDTNFMWRLVADHGSRVKMSTRAFIEGWLEQCYQGATNLETCNALLRRQEVHNKGNRAKLRASNEEAINYWIGLSQVEYRFPQVRQLVRDIRDAEKLNGGDDARLQR